MSPGPYRPTQVESGPLLNRNSAIAVVLSASVAGGIGMAQSVTLTTSAGAPDDLQAVLESASLTLATVNGDAPSALDIVAAARADYRGLLTALYANGHYGGTISITLDGVEAAAIQPLDAPERIGEVAIAIDPGPVFRFGQASVTPLAPDTEIPATFAPGQVAGSEQVRAAVLAGVDGWRAIGHALALPSGERVAAVHPRSILDVAVTLDPGPRLRFARPTISGNVEVRTGRIYAIAGIPEGAIFAPDILALAATRLRRTGAFQSVSLTEGTVIVAPDRLPIAIEVVEMLPRRLGFGAELSSVDGLALSAFWLHRNILGGAESLRIEGEVTGIVGQSGGADATLTLSFGRPATFGPDTDLTVEAALTYLDEADYRLLQFTAQAGLIRYTRADLTYEAGVGILTAREETDLQTRDYTLLTLPLSATLDRRSDPLDAVSGYFIDLDITPFVGLVGAESGARIFADARYYRSFGAGDRVTLAARAQAGSVLGAGLLEAPADFLFYSGGGGTVRGQPYQALGITSLVDGEFVNSGGASFVGAQLEARVQITEKLEIVGFYDVGTVGAGSFPDSGSDWHAGAGFGARYATGIGPIRIDIATPATGDDAGQSVQLYIGIGQSF